MIFNWHLQVANNYELDYCKHSLLLTIKEWLNFEVYWYVSACIGPSNVHTVFASINYFFHVCVVGSVSEYGIHLKNQFAGGIAFPLQ